MGATEGWFLSLGTRRLDLPVGDHVIGRSRDCDIVVRDPTVSRAHALVAVERGRVTVQDLGSSNGVSVNGQRIGGEVELADGDQVRLGRVRMTLARGARSAPRGAAECAICGAPVEPGARVCPHCGEPIAADRPLSRSEAVGMSEVMAVGEALARPARSLDETLPPYPAPWEDPEAVAPSPGEGAATQSSAVTLTGDEADPEAFDDPASPAAVARAAEEDSPPPRSPLAAAAEAADDAAEGAPEGAAAPVAEGAVAGLYLPAAGFWVRAAAFSLDLVGPVLLAAVAGLAAGGWSTATGLAVGSVAGVVAWMAVSIPFWMRRGDSPGKRLLGLRVCDLDGRPGIDGGQAVRRFAGYLLGVLTLGLGFVAVGLSAGRRGLHDRLADTYVARAGDREAVAMIGRRR
ncbi:MAG TPA: FHA domain-containing protein [Thermoanaerobaculia bacterium]|nr:FHA domain-containing protein [Thermoanaerobaculia bacterium]